MRNRHVAKSLQLVGILLDALLAAGGGFHR